ncbi:MAG: hypothetical protein KDD45_10670 [Bdellovibrionales bacterium]|nr:hypothetical protein [Bdellovibrionales bacterium]
MLALNPADRKRCSSIAGALYDYEGQILDLEPFTPSNYRGPQRPSYGYQQVSYSQPPTTISQQPIYSQYGQPVSISQGSYQQVPIVRSSVPMSQPQYSLPQGAPIYYRNQP